MPTEFADGMSMPDGDGGAFDSGSEATSNTSTEKCAMRTADASDCGPCIDGYSGDMQTGCAPTLTALGASVGSLSPGLATATTEYQLDVSLTTQTITLLPAAADNVTISVDGVPLGRGKVWTSSMLDLGSNPVRIVLTQPGHPSNSYTLNIKRGYIEAYVKSDVPASDANFGASIAVYDNILVVGAPNESGPVTGSTGTSSQSGAAYIFQRTESGWAQVAHLKASNADAQDYFGASVAVSSSLVVVGAPGEDSATADETNNEATNSGAAYVFTLAGRQTAYLKQQGIVGANDHFGDHVAASRNIVVVSASEEDSAQQGIGKLLNDNNATRSGSVYVYTCPAGTCGSGTTLKGSNTGAGDLFGASVSVFAESGTPIVVVGAPGEDSPSVNVDGIQSLETSSNSGAAYVFTVASGIEQAAYLKASNTDVDDLFGSSVSASQGLVVVGAPSEASSAVGVNGNPNDNTAPSSGAAYLYSNASGAWHLQAYLKATNSDSGDQFGSAVAVWGATVVVGAPEEGSNAVQVGGNQLDNSARGAGAAYTFVSAAGNFVPQAYFKGSNSGASDGFGREVAISDGEVVVGAEWDSRAVSGVSTGTFAPTDARLGLSGAAYIFR